MDTKASDSLRGYLYKWTNYLKGYQKRWFILQNGLLSYYRNQAEMAHTCRGTINLANATITSTGSTTFLISNSSTQTFHLKAACESEQKMWVNILTAAKSKALALRKAGDDSDVYTEGDEDDVEIKNSTMSADDAMRLANQLLTKMEHHLVDLQRHQDALSRKGDDLQRSLAELDSSRDPTEAVQRLAAVRERSTVFEVASLAMVHACAEFASSGRRQTERWRRIFNSQRERCALLEQMIEELAKQLRQLEMLVKHNNPHASFQLPNFNHSIGTPAYSHLGSLPGQAVRVGGNQNLQKETHNAIAQSNACGSTASVTNKLIPAQCTSSKKSSNDHFVTEAAPRVTPVLEAGTGELCHVPVASRFTGADSSDEDYFDAVDANSEFSVYLPPTSDPVTVTSDTNEGGTITAGSYSTTRADSASVTSASLVEDGSCIPSGTEVDHEYESDVCCTDEDDDVTENHIRGMDKKTRKPLREARVIQPRTRRHESRSATLVPPQDRDSELRSDSSSERDRVEDAVKATDTVIVPVRQLIRPRRTTIPPRPNYSLNLWSIMKNCIGKELTKIPMPVNFSEPLSMLQRLTEDFEYSACLDRAAQSQDSLEQMALVAAFTVSSYATTAVRVNKPFNPILSETYECDRTDDLGWRSLAEQVSHHPPKCALHCESNAWYCWFEFSMNTKFRGKYLQINPIGTCHLVFRSTGHHYTWQKIPMTVHNIIVGRLWIDNSGEMDIVNHNTGEKCHMSYKAYSYFSSETPRRVTGAVTDKSGAVRYVLNGTWDESIEYAPVVSTRQPKNGKPVLETGPARVAWQRNPLPPDAERMHYFTLFAIQLNAEEPGVCPTDSRLRPDQRLMENGKWDEANREKVILEEKQRHRRRQMAASLAAKALGFPDTPIDSSSKRNSTAQSEPPALTPAVISNFLDQADSAHRPLWFERRFDQDTGEAVFSFTGKYWEAKAAQDWSMCPEIY